MNDLLVVVCLVFTRANMTNFVANAHLIYMIQIEDTDAIIGVNNIELVTIPHDTTCVHLDSMEGYRAR